jgi:hypothetical protein
VHHVIVQNRQPEKKSETHSAEIERAEKPILSMVIIGTKQAKLDNDK